MSGWTALFLSKGPVQSPTADNVMEHDAAPLRDGECLREALSRTARGWLSEPLCTSFYNSVLSHLTLVISKPASQQRLPVRHLQERGSTQRGKGGRKRNERKAEGNGGVLTTLAALTDNFRAEKQLRTTALGEKSRSPSLTRCHR